MGSKNSGDAQREAARRSTELSKNQSLINSQLMAPYAATGQLAAQDLWGYGKTTGGGNTYGYNSGGGATVPYMTSTGSKWNSPTNVGYDTYGKVGAGVDRTGGAGAYIGQISDLVKSASTPGVSTQQYIDQLGNYGQNFKFNANDPAYTYKRDEAGKSIDKALASRGLFDSRAGVNMLSDSDRAILSDEYEKQYGRGYQTLTDLFKMGSSQDEALLNRNVTDYNRQYGGLSDLFNMTKGMGETNYQSLLDAVKVGTGASSAAGQLGNQATGNTISSYGMMANAGAQNDANNASLWSGIGAMPMNAMLLYNLLGGGKTSATGNGGMNWYDF